VSALQGALADYLATRRALGYKLERAEKLLRQFLAYLAEHEAETITVEHALAWATLPAKASAHWFSYRLGAVRGFAVYLQTIDPACEVPPTDLLPGRSRRATPYIYSEAQIAALIEAAGTLSTSHRTATYRTLISLLAVTGMRIGEAIALNRAGIEWPSDLIVIRNTKFGKSREVPLHPSTTAALRRYLRRSDRPSQAADTDAVFVSGAGTRLLYCGVQWTFARLLVRAGIEPRSAECRPRLHDLRHTFAVWTIRDAYRDCEADVGPRLAALSTYLGHVDPSRTYWYLSAAPELMAVAADRLERHLGGDQ
jgi:integrase/recombinase XerD